MDCGQFQSLLTAYEDRELEQRNLLLFESHLAACPHCAREWQHFQKTLRLLQAVQPLPTPPGLRAGIHEKLAREGVAIRLGRALQKIFAPVPLTAAASLTAVALATTFVVRNPTISDRAAGGVSPPARFAQTEQTENRQPPLVTLPVSLGRTKAASAELNPQIGPPERNSYYQSFLEREGADLSHLAMWDDHYMSLDEGQPAATKWRIGPPLAPDVTIRVHHLSADELKWLHSRIEKEGRWQTRLYPRNYFLVLVNQDELPALYNLLQRQHLPFSTHPLPEAERATRKPLLVAVRP